jgi:PAS domain S-box-containing protein
VSDISERMQNQRVIESLNAAARIVQHASLSRERVFEAVTDQLTALGFFSIVALVDEPSQELVFSALSGDERVLQVLQNLTKLEDGPHRVGFDQVDVYSKAIRGRESSYFTLHEEFLTQVFPGCDVGFPSAILRLLPPQKAAIIPLIADDKVLGVLSVAGKKIAESILPATRAFANQAPIAIRNAQQVDELYESEKQYRGVFEATTDALLLLDPSGAIAEANPAACAMYGRSHKELVGLSIAQIVHPDHYHDLQDFHASISSKDRFHAQSINIRSDGTVFPVEVHGSQVSYKGSMHLLAVVTDISERVQAQKALVRSEKLQALGQMAGGIAHDFNNILVGIRGYTDMALLDLTEDIGMVRSDLEHVLIGANDAAEAVRRLQALYRQADDTSDFAALQLDDIVSETLALTQPRWKDQPQAQDITIDVHTDLTTPPLILGNGSELRRVLTNLVVNAVDAMPDGGTLAICTGQKERHVLMTVSDTGVGMDKQIQDQVFDPFFTTKNTTGLGLTISQNIIERHRGEITVESTLGKGTTFTIRIPLFNAPEPAINQQLAAEQAQGVQTGLRILAVDDEEATCNLLRRLLEHEKHTVVTAHSGREAIAALEKDRFDLIISDLGMPDISGLQVTRHAYKLHPEMPIVLSTGWGETVTPQQLEEMHVMALLSKPFSRKDLLAVLDRIAQDHN